MKTHHYTIGMMADHSCPPPEWRACARIAPCSARTPRAYPAVTLEHAVHKRARIEKKLSRSVSRSMVFVSSPVCCTSGASLAHQLELRLSRGTPDRADRLQTRIHF